MKTFIPISEPSLKKIDTTYVLNAVRSGWISSLGKYITEFEEQFAAYVGSRYALATANGTTALHLVLASYGISAGDEVIVPDLSFIATANAVAYTGAKPIFVDVDPMTWCLDPGCAERAVSRRTKAIIPVHLYGHPADMDALKRVAQKRGLFIIEDAAEAHGSEYKHRKVGSLGDAGIFSFYGNKIITTGEGGMITTDDKKLFEKARFLRDHAMSPTKRYWHSEIGYNYRMTNIQAALGVAQLKRIDAIIKKKRTIFSWYKCYLGSIAGISLNPEASWARNVFWMVSLLRSPESRISRDSFMARLKDRGVDSRPFFYPMSGMPMYNGKTGPVTRDLSARGINLPSAVTLRKKDICYICDTIKTTLSAT